MGFNWSGAARGAGDALQQMMAERYARTEDARRIAREIARDEEEQRRYKRQQDIGIEDRALTAMNRAEDVEQRRLDRERMGRIDAMTAQQWEDQRRRATATEHRDIQDRAVQSMMAAGVRGGGLNPYQATLQGLEQGVNVQIPENPETVREQKLKDAEELLKLQRRYATPAGGGTQEGTRLVRMKADGTPEYRNVVGSANINQAYQEGFVPEPSAAERAKILTPEEKKQARAIASNALDQAVRLYNHPGLGKATGAYEMRGFTQDATNFNSIREQLIASLAYPKLGALKGQMSDKDVAFIQNLATRLKNHDIDDIETKKAIVEAVVYLSDQLGVPIPDLTPPAAQRSGRVSGRAAPTQSRPAGPPATGLGLDPILDELLRTPRNAQP